MSDGQETAVTESLVQIGTAAPQLAPMSPAIAFKNVVGVVRSVNGNADTHDLLTQSLGVIRARLLRADELEAQLTQNAPIPSLATSESSN